jgi:GT2 family glycosyltransferase
MGYFDFKTIREVDQPMASALLVRKKAVDSIGLMDECLDMFFNDVDWCYRIKKAGFKIEFFPQAKVLHHVGSSTRKRRVAMIYHSHLGFFRYLKKHHSSGWRVLLLIVAGAGLTLTGLMRVPLAILKKRSEKRNPQAHI